MPPTADALDIGWHCVRSSLVERSTSFQTDALAKEGQVNPEVWRRIAESSYDWQSWIAEDGTVRWVNGAVTRITGYSVGECLAMSGFPRPLVLPGDLNTFEIFEFWVAEHRCGMICLFGSRARMVRLSG